ncbi:MAG TPA: hypothetical protein VL096_19060, partial [Pirellulaceae bacterium]|nr:hypothetical protein [Pirellulaceae bacterium]
MAAQAVVLVGQAGSQPHAILAVARMSRKQQGGESGDCILIYEQAFAYDWRSHDLRFEVGQFLDAPSAAGGFTAHMMSNPKLRRQIAYEAARLMYLREESEYFRAKQKAARRFCQGWVKPADLPSNTEIRDEIQSLARLYEGQGRFDRLREMRIHALQTMRLLARFRPRLIGSV